ncbi:MAG: HAMP domain-containing histidine kinase [Roseiflexaceae bacterium]|nr:HAMP domain-containing histidine kinase [Roseiflexaceae bacterium]
MHIQPRRWARPDRVTLFAVVLGVFILMYCLVLPFARAQTSTLQFWFYQLNTLVLVGIGLILLAASQRGRTIRASNQRYAAIVLLIGVLLAAIGVFFHIPAFDQQRGGSFSIGTVLYTVSLLCCNAGLLLLVPFRTVSLLHMLRISFDAALVMTLCSVLLNLLLPYILVDVTWTPAFNTAIFRLELDLALVVVYWLLYRSYASFRGLPLVLLVGGAAAMILTDIVFMVAHMLPVQAGGNTLLSSALPFWQVHLLLWSTALYQLNRRPLRWRLVSESDLLPAVTGMRILLQSLGVFGLVTVLFALEPDRHVMAGLLTTLLCRETLVTYERARLVRLQNEAREQLSEAKTSLEETVAEKTQILEQRTLSSAEIAHDMGNTLQEVRLAISMVKLKCEDHHPELLPLFERYLRSADSALVYQDNLLAAMVAAAQMDAGELRLSLAPSDIGALVRSLVAQYQGRATDSRVTLTLRIASQASSVLADERLVGRAVANVLGNAIKYTGAARRDGSGHVEISVQRAGRLVTVQIDDNGPGIESTHMQKVGQRFARGVRGRHAPTGTGLGLAFSRGVLQRHPGGSLRVSSHPGAGTSVTLSLLQHKLPAQPAHAARSPRTAAPPHTEAYKHAPADD